MNVNVNQQCLFENPGRIVVIGDIHGDIDRLVHIFISLKLFSDSLEWIAQPPNTIVIQLGDQIDSLDRTGINASWDTNSLVCKEGILDLNIITFMDKLDAIAIHAGHGGRVLSLIGNHEVLNIMHDFSYVSQCSLNIVNATYRKELFARGTGELAHMLAKRNIVVKIGKFLFCHGGIIPVHFELLKNTYGVIDLHIINTIFRKFVLAESLNQDEYNILLDVIIGNDGILWTRHYMNILTKIEANSANSANSANNSSVLNDALQLSVHNELSSILEQTESLGMFIGHNTVDTITGISNNKLYFVDAALSRAYNTNRIQIVELVTHNDNTVVNLVEIPCA